MKKFLMTCIIAMFSAGIYGFIDMSRDIKNGTMIKYEDQSGPKVKAYTRARTQSQAINNSIQVKLAEYTEAKKKREEEKKNLVLTNIKFEDFSRGEEIYIPEPEVTTEATDAPTTTSKTDTVKTVTPPTTQVKKISDSTSIASVEEPVLNASMFSRGSPRMFKKTFAKK